MREATTEDGFLLRRAARVLWECDLEAPETAARLRQIADHLDAPDICEGCDKPTRDTDIDGVPICPECAQELSDSGKA